MSLREALGQARLLTLLVLAGMGWIVFTAAKVLGDINYWNPADVGHTAATGVVGLVVLAAVFVAALSLFGELGESEPAPDAWPPEGEA